LAWRTLLLGIGLFGLAFLLGFLLGFPTAAVKQKIVNAFREHQATAELQSLRLSPFLSLEGKNLTIRMDDTSLPPLAVERFSLRPLWGTLFSAQPGAKIDANLLQGEVQAEVQGGGDGLQVQANGLHFTLPIENGMATLSGTLASGRLQRTGGDRKTGESTLALVFGELSAQSPLLATTANRPLALGQVTLDARGRGQAYSITRLESNGGDLSLTGTGNVLLGRTAATSRLNLALKLRPTASLPAELKGLLDLMATPAGDGSYSVQISGTLSQPMIATAAPAAAGASGAESNAAEEE
jgi:type II secretion system protein N